MPNAPSTADRVIAYRPALDGVRAFAVTAVVLYHGGVAALPGGFLGVDAFFVLSGYLITSLLLGEHRRQGSIMLAAFWGRRARRLLPALFTMLLVVVVVGHFLLPPVEVGLLRGDALAAIGYVANWRMIFRGGDYFAQTAAPSPLQHTWSLGVEEQFYLLWPLIVVLLLGRFGGVWARRALLAFCVVGATISATVCWLEYRPADVNRAYFGTDTRAQALMIGCALALLLTRAGQRVHDDSAHPFLGALAVAGAAGTGWLWTHAHGTDTWLYHGGFTAAALCTAAVLAHAVTGSRSMTARLLSVPALTWLGRISYGVYLWHWPLFQFITADRTGLTGAALLALRCTATLAAAIMSYALVEQPLRRARRPLQVPAPLLAAAASAVTAAVAVGVTVPSQSPAPTRQADPPVYTAPPAGGATTGTSAAPGTETTTLSPMQRPDRRPGPTPRIDIFGDSVAWTIGTYLPPHTGLTITTRAIEGCGITLQHDILEMGTPHTLYPYCTSWPAHWTAGVTADDPDIGVILLNRWELMDAKVNGGYQHVGQPAFDTYLTGQLDQAVAIVAAHHAAVVLLTAAYTHRAERPDGGLYDEDLPARVDAWNALLTRDAASHPGTVTLLDLNHLVDPNGRYTATLDGISMRSDGLHFTPAAVQRIIAPWLLPQLAALASTDHP